MATTNAGAPSAQGETATAAPPKPVTNDFSIQIATVNGSGSQSANSVLLRSIFAMGVPVSGKNLFPSNIAGLPTWFTIRASKDGYVARRKEIDILIAMNAETSREDMPSLRPGSVGHLRRNRQSQAVSRRRHLLSGSLRQAHRRRLSRSQAAQAGQQHDLRRCRGAAARPST